MGSKLPTKPPKDGRDGRYPLPPPPPPRSNASTYRGPFIEVSRIGFCENGKATTYVGFSGKRTIERGPSRPLSCFIVPLVKDLLPWVSYDSAEQLAEDVATIKEMLDSLEFQHHT